MCLARIPFLGHHVTPQRSVSAMLLIAYDMMRTSGLYTPGYVCLWTEDLGGYSVTYLDIALTLYLFWV